MNLDDQIAQITDPQEFTRLCNVILTEKYSLDFQIIDGTRSDQGNDGYIISEKRVVAMYCPIKPERRTDSDYLEKIRSDINKAQGLRDSGKFEVENWTFITPRKLSNDIIVKMRQEGEKVGIKATHQESTFLANELLRNKHLIKAFSSLHLSELDDKIDEILIHLKSSGLKHDQIEEEIDKDSIYKGEAKNIDEMKQLFIIRRTAKYEDAKPALKTIYYATSDLVVKLNAILGILDFYDPSEDSKEDILNLCDEGILISTKLNANSVKAHILAQKGYMLSMKYSDLDMYTAINIRMDNAIGFQTITKEYQQNIIKKLGKLENEYNSAFSEALSITKEKNDYRVMAAVLIFIGNAAGQRACYLNTLGVKERAASERANFKTAFMAAKEIYSFFNDELGVAHSLFNLANQIRFFGEESEAISLVNNVIDTAKKNNDSRLLQKAGWLLETLETGYIPDYMAGERREKS